MAPKRGRPRDSLGQLSAAILAIVQQHPEGITLWNVKAALYGTQASPLGYPVGVASDRPVDLILAYDVKHAACTTAVAALVRRGLITVTRAQDVAAGTPRASRSPLLTPVPVHSTEQT